MADRDRCGATGKADKSTITAWNRANFSYRPWSFNEVVARGH